MNEFFKKPVVKILMLKGEKGNKGDTGTGTPAGGKTGQYLQKKTDADYDYRWSDITTVQWDDVTGKTEATTSAAGLMSAEDKKAIDKLNNFGLDGLTKYGDRLSSANDVPGSDSKLRYIIATDSMTEGKPLLEGCIIHMAWDNYYDWATQLFIPNIQSGNAQNRPMQFRGKDGDKHEWCEWISVYSENNPQTSTTKLFTLSASSWSSGNYTISDSMITASSNQEILPAIGITADQLKALQKAMIVDGGQSAGSLTLTALGTVPTIDIPIRVIFRGTI